MKSKAMKEVNVKDIYVGVVSHIKVLNEKEGLKDEEGRYLVPAITSNNKKVMNLKVRKMVFVKRGNQGYELPSGLFSSSKYNYRIVNLSTDCTKNGELNVKNNTLIINEPRSVGNLLSVVGFPNVVKGSDLRKVKKFLLSEDKNITFRKHSLKLTSRGFLDLDKVAEANEEASSYYYFKEEKLPIKPQEKEKQYAKHFK